jgi:hypothetical protein
MTRLPLFFYTRHQTPDTRFSPLSPQSHKPWFSIFIRVVNCANGQFGWKTGKAALCSGHTSPDQVTKFASAPLINHIYHAVFQSYYFMFCYLFFFGFFGWNFQWEGQVGIYESCFSLSQVYHIIISSSLHYSFSS